MIQIENQSQQQIATKRKESKENQQNDDVLDEFARLNERIEAYTNPDSSTQVSGAEKLALLKSKHHLQQNFGNGLSSDIKNMRKAFK